MGEDVEAVKLAMVEKSGPLYEKAVDTIGKQQAVRSFASILWTDFFPEGEQKQRMLQPEFIKAAEAGKLTEFFDKYPEYEARLMRNDWENPEKMMGRFLRSSIWDAYLGMDKLQQEAVRDSFGELFTENFLNKKHTKLRQHQTGHVCRVGKGAERCCSKDCARCTADERRVSRIKNKHHVQRVPGVAAATAWLRPFRRVLRLARGDAGELRDTAPGDCGV